MEAIASESTQVAMSCVSSPLLMKGQHAQQQANMKANEHADAQQEWEGPNHGSPALLLLAPG